MEKQANNIQGIFRLSGSAQHIQQLRKDFDKGEDVNLNEVDDPHVVAALLKLYLREMPDPPFPFALYDKLIETHTTYKDQALAKLTSLIDQELPIENKNLLRFLLKILHNVESNNVINKMTSSNLSIVFAPNMIRGPRETPQETFMHAPIINSITRLLIENYKTLLPVLEAAQANRSLTNL